MKIGIRRIFMVIVVLTIGVLADSTSVLAVWDCRNNSTYENVIAYDYQVSKGRQDRAECVRGRIGCNNPEMWSDECLVACTNPSGCGSCEARCIGDQVYFADIWRNNDNRLRSATCRHIKKDGNNDRHSNLDSDGRTALCYPVAIIENFKKSYKHGESVLFKGRGTDPNEDNIVEYRWRIRTVSNNDNGIHDKDLTSNEQIFSSSNLAVGKYIAFLRVADEVSARSRWVWKSFEVVVDSVNDWCVDEKEIVIGQNLCSYNKNAGCRKTSSTTINAPYAGDYTIKLRVDRGTNNLNDCQGEEDFHMVINEQETPVLMDPAACEHEGTKNYPTISGKYYLKKGVNVIDSYHEHPDEDVGAQSIGIEAIYLSLKECPVAECGSAHDNKYERTSEFYDSTDNHPDKRCDINGNVVFPGSWNGNTGLTGNNGLAWTWKCEKDTVKVNCWAKKKGSCNDDPSLSPYKDKEKACKVGAFNSVALGWDSKESKKVLTWKCGTGKDTTAQKFLGNFFGGNSNERPLVGFDNYAPVAGGDNCKCYPRYEYVCEQSTPNCQNKCGVKVVVMATALKKDISCFLDQFKVVTKAEFNSKKKPSQEECKNTQFKCPDCGINSVNTGEGGNTIVEIN